MLRTILRASCVLGAIAAVAGTVTVMGSGTSTRPDQGWLLVGLFWLAYAALLLVTIPRHLPYALRGIVLLAILSVLGALEVSRFGLSPDSLVFFLAAVVFATILFDHRHGIAMLAIVVLILLAAAVLITSGTLQLLPGVQGVAAQPASWVSTGLVFLTITVGIAISFRGLVAHLSRVISQERQARLRLETTHETLRTTQQRLDALMEHSADIVLILDEAGLVRYRGPSATSLLGHPRGEAVGADVFRLVHPDDAAASRDLFQAILAAPGTCLSGRFRFRHATGAWRWLEIDGTNALDVPSVRGIIANCRDVTEHQRADEVLRASEWRFRWLVENGSDIITVLDNTGVISYESPSITRLLGYQPEELIGRNAFGFVHQDDIAPVVAAFQQAFVATTATTAITFRFRHQDGSWRILESVGLNPLPGGGDSRLIVNSRDVTERVRIEAALRESEERFRRMSEASSEAIVIHHQGRILDINPAYERMFGFTAEELRGQFIYDRIAPESLPIVRANVARGYDQPYELVVVRKDGSTFPVEGHGKTITIDGQVSRVTLMRDITERKQSEAELRDREERLTHQAFHDGLTDLPNRALFMERLSRALARSRRRGTTAAVLFLDLDRFKVINDSLGHGAGDQLLLAVAERLRHCLREEDTVARMGGDEFTILLEEVADSHEAVQVAERVIQALQPPFRLNEQEAVAGTSIGIALEAAGADQPADLLRAAEVAMYSAKQSGTTRLALFDPSMHIRAVERLRLEGELRRALAENQLWVAYQPIMTLANEQVIGVEALMRWSHPERGLISPATFIPIAEETGLILPIGWWILAEACRQVRHWQTGALSGIPIELSVNLSVRQFQHPDLIAMIREILTATSFDPTWLKLELTESVVMEEAEANIRRLRQLKELGVQLAIDDFGTGYSSLSYLRRFPVDVVKVDRSFVAGLGHNPEDTAIVRAIVTLAHTLGLQVTAEGIEQAGQLATLRALGGTTGQGYYFTRPLPANEIEGWLVARSPAAAPLSCSTPPDQARAE